MEFAQFTDAEVKVLLDALAYRMSDRAAGNDLGYTKDENEALTRLAMRVAYENGRRIGE